MPVIKHAWQKVACRTLCNTQVGDYHQPNGVLITKINQPATALSPNSAKKSNKSWWLMLFSCTLFLIYCIRILYKSYALLKPLTCFVLSYWLFLIYFFLQSVGPNSLMFIRNLLDKLTSNQQNILKFIACNEIFLMPATVFMLFRYVHDHCQMYFSLAKGQCRSCNYRSTLWFCDVVWPVVQQRALLRFTVTLWRLHEN